MVLSIVAVVIAIALPLLIAWIKKPRFLLLAGKPTAVNDDWYIHVRIINEPIRWPLGKVLLRNTATGCHASLTFEGTEIKDVPASWPAKPDAWVVIPLTDGRLGYIFDPTKLEQRFRIDLEPSETGEVIIIAIKGDREAAHAISKASYTEAWRNELRAPQLLLPPGERRLTVRVAAGGVEGEGRFVVRNSGSARKDLSIMQVPSPHPASKAAIPEFIREGIAVHAERSRTVL